jgi:putative MATE family efflux protein
MTGPDRKQEIQTSPRRDWTQGSILKNLLLLSWPITVTQTLMSLGPTIDMIWVGKLGDTAVAAVGVSGVVVQLAMGVVMGFTSGMMALVSRSYGARDYHSANRVAQQAMVLAILYAVLMALVGQFFGEKIIRIITTDPETVLLGTAYLRIEFIGGATVIFRMMMDSIMQGSGDTVNPMWIAIAYRSVHIALSPFLIFGLWIFPELGVRGAAITGVTAQTLGVILGLRVLLGKRSRIRVSFKGFRFDFSTIWRIIRIGFPSSIAGIQRNLSQFLLQIFIAPFGTVALAAHVITQRIEMFLLMPAMSFGGGAGVLVGQNLGADKPKRAEKSAWLGVSLVQGFVFIVSIAVLIWTRFIIRIFSTDPALDVVAAQFIRIAVAGWIFMGFNFVLMNCLQTAGDTVPPMIFAVTSTWLVTILLSFLLPRYTGAGVLGIRWAMSGSVFASAFAMVVYFRTGKWQKRRV